MTQPAPSPMIETTFALTLLLLLVAPLAIAGVALINTGLGRSRSAAQSLLGCLAILSTSVLAFALVGAAFAASTGQAQVPCFSADSRPPLPAHSLPCSLNFSPLPSLPSFPGVPVQIAFASPPELPRPSPLPSSFSPSSHIGRGAAAGSHSSGSTFLSAQDFLMAAALALSTFSADSPHWQLSGLPARAKANFPAKALAPRCPLTTPSTSSSAVCSRLSDGWLGTWPALFSG